MTDHEHYRRNYKIDAAPRDDSAFQVFFWFISAAVVFVIIQAAMHLSRGEL